MLEQAQDEESELSAKKALEVPLSTGSTRKVAAQGRYRFWRPGYAGGATVEEFPQVRDEQQQRFSHILVDEFQDINRASGVLLRLLAGDERRVWVVATRIKQFMVFAGLRLPILAISRQIILAPLCCRSAATIDLGPTL